MTTKCEVSVLQGHEDPLEDLAISNDGGLLASCDAGIEHGHVVLWDIATGRQRQQITSPSWDPEDVGANDLDLWRACRVAFCPTLKVLAYGGIGPPNDTNQQGIFVWNYEAERLERVMLGPRGTISSLVFSPDGRVLARAQPMAKLAYGIREPKRCRCLQTPIVVS
jgi:hypothetical protein